MNAISCNFIYTAIPAFGPTAAAAQIEADKSFAKHFMVRHGIPTARFQSFRDADEACNYIMRYFCALMFVPVLYKMTQWCLV